MFYSYARIGWGGGEGSLGIQKCSCCFSFWKSGKKKTQPNWKCVLFDMPGRGKQTLEEQTQCRFLNIGLMRCKLPLPVWAEVLCSPAEILLRKQAVFLGGLPRAWGAKLYTLLKLPERLCCHQPHTLQQLTSGTALTRKFADLAVLEDRVNPPRNRIQFKLL